MFIYIQLYNFLYNYIKLYKNLYIINRHILHIIICIIIYIY